MPMQQGMDAHAARNDAHAAGNDAAGNDAHAARNDAHAAGMMQQGICDLLNRLSALQCLPYVFWWGTSGSPRPQRPRTPLAYLLESGPPEEQAAIAQVQEI